MKKLLSLLLALMMLLGCTAFAEAADYVGNWVLTRLETPEMTMDMALLNQLGMGMTMTLNADGTMYTDTMGVKEEGTWVVTATGIAMTDDEETLQVAYVDDMLRIEEDGAAMLLAREGAVPQEDAGAQADPGAADYNYVGAWVLASVEMFGMQMEPSAVGVSGDVALYEDGTCTLTMLDETQEGTWAVTETGITTTDAKGVVDTYTLTNGQLVVEESGMKLIFVPYAPMSGLTVADFNGDWALSYVEVYDYAAGTQDFYEAEETGMTIALTLADGKGHIDMATSEGAEAYDADCIVEALEDGTSVMYFLFLDENGAQDGTGLMLMMYPGSELVWYEYDSEADVEYYYNFVPKAE